MTDILGHKNKDGSAALLLSTIVLGTISPHTHAKTLKLECNTLFVCILCIGRMGGDATQNLPN